MMRWILLSIWLSLPVMAAAERERLGTLPRKPKAAGFLATVSMEALAGHGYQPVHIDFSPFGGRFPATRSLQVVVSPRSHSDGDALDFDMIHDVNLPQGAGSHQTTIYVPYYCSWDALAVRILEEGELIDTAKTRFNVSNLRLQYLNQVSSVGILAPRDAAAQDADWKRFPDVRTLNTVLGDGPLPEGVGVDRLDHQAAQELAASVQPANVQYRRLEEDALPTTWLGYSQLDIILVAAPLLRRLEDEQPERRAALDAWVAAGGNLWVYAADENTGELFPGIALTAPPSSAALTSPQLPKVIELSGENDTSGWEYTPWQGPYRESSQYQTFSGSTSGSFDLRPRLDVFRELKEAGHPLVAGQQAAEFQSRVRQAELGAGTITTIAVEDPFPGSFLLWESIRRLHPGNQLHWTRRNGVDVPSGNASYWSFLIESLGQPPVKTFILLNTLFGIAIGPFCYFFFRRRNRLYLLFFAAPAVAVLVTGGLFLYALASDGIHTRARTRTLTWLDPRGDYACTESRHTYYAVFNRHGGLQFPREAMVLPIRGTPLSSAYGSANTDRLSAKKIRFTDAAQRFRGAFLPARDQVQYLTREPRREDRCFRCDFTTDPESPTVENPFSYPVHRILVRDSQRQYWLADDVVAGGTARLRQTDRQAVQAFRDVVWSDDGNPVPSLGGWTTGYSLRQRTIGRQQSRLDQLLNRWTERGLPPGRFLAVAAASDDALAVEAAVVVEQSHVVFGALP